MNMNAHINTHGRTQIGQISEELQELGRICMDISLWIFCGTRGLNDAINNLHDCVYTSVLPNAFFFIAIISSIYMK